MAVMDETVGKDEVGVGFVDNAESQEGGRCRGREQREWVLSNRHRQESKRRPGVSGVVGSEI